MAEDLVVDVASVRAAAQEVRAAAAGCEPVLPVVEGVMFAALFGELSEAAHALTPWAREVDALSAQAVRRADAGVSACEQVVAVDQELGR